MPERPTNGSPPRPGTLGRDPAPGHGRDGLLEEGFRVEAPSVSLPKGGGAISGIGEKVSANPVTGSASVSIPLPLTKGRGGFTPSLGLAYDSGAGNGPFGLGWRLTRPSVRRKTDKGLPTYRGDEDSFVLSDVEDLVPLMTESGGTWSIATRVVVDGAETWDVRRYRPRVEGAFALIERWRRQGDRYTWWRTISADNVKRVYGKSTQARVVDPEDGIRVFEWLLEEERDELGNVISYQYLEEDGAGLSSHPAERDRSATYRYLSRVSYGNTDMGENPDDGGTGSFRFHLVFDYGGHDSSDPALTASGTWTERADSFSSFRSRFDIRCRRLCRRVLMFHEFAQLRDDGSGAAVPVVVDSVTLTYTEQNTVSTLASAQAQGWSWNGSSYDSETLPAVSFTYAQPTIDRTVRFVDGLEELPNGLDMRSWQFVDLDGEGMSGLLSEQGGAWYYKRNEGDGSFARACSLRTRPGLSLGQRGARLVDLDGDGRLELVVMSPGLSGSQARTAEGSWAPFRSFRSVPNQRSDHPDTRFVDLDGDGQSEFVVTEGDHLLWYPSLGLEGFGEAVRVPMPHDQDKGPRFMFSRNGTEFFLADMTGDGLSDVVRIRNGSISYWPALGFGRFGDRIQMKGAPRFDRPDHYDPSRLRLADLDGSGPTDLLYIGPKGLRLWFNEAGNGWSQATEIARFPAAARPHELQVSDLLGDGTSCLVWSAPYLKQRVRPLMYMKLMSEGKPWLMTVMDNGLGKQTRLTYTPSTSFYVADRRAGTPWATRLPFPVQCLSKVETVDSVTGWRFVNEYAYHHGYFDGAEREFRGFGMVEQWDTETVSDYDESGTGPLVQSQPPIRSRTWFHTGAWQQEGTLTAAYATEYSTVDPLAPTLGEPTVPSGLSTEDLRGAHRALKGRVLRHEVYAEDGSGNLDILYTVSQQTYAVALLQPGEGDSAASFRVDLAESLSATYDLDDLTGGTTADPRISHTITLEVDDYGVPTRSAVVSYPRRASSADLQQSQQTVVISEQGVIHQDDQVVASDVWHIGVPAWSKTWELTGGTSWSGEGSDIATVATLASEFSLAVIRAFEDVEGTVIERRLIGHQATLYWNDALGAALPLESLGLRKLVYQSYALAFTQGVVTDRFGTRVSSTELTEGGYVDLGLDLDEDAITDVAWWVPSGRLTPVAAAFYVPGSHTDAFGNVTTLTWDADILAITQVTMPATQGPPPVSMTVSAEIDYRLMIPAKVTDPNGTETEATFDPLGRVSTTAIRNGTEGDAIGAVSAEFVYDTTSLPASVYVKQRCEHGGTDWQESWVYSDGSGNVVQTKARVAPGDAPTVSGGTVTWAHADPRYVGTGRTVVDNKGNVVKQYEPFFSTTSAYEDEDELVEWGVSSTFTYDPVGRNTQVTLPDGNIRTWSYTPWSVVVMDEEDNTVGGPHEGTATVTNLDALVRVYQLVETPDGVTDHETKLALDVQGNVISVTDPRGNTIQVQSFDILGRPAFTGSADEGYDASSGDGETYALLDVTGQPIRSWKSGNLAFRRTYDELRRPTCVWVDEGSGEKLVECRFYGDALSDATGYTQGLPVRVYDTAGELRFDHDFRGRTIEQARTVILDITNDADWSGIETQATLADIDAWLALPAHDVLDSETFTITTSHDALDRIVEQITPDSSRLLPGYDEGGRLTTVQVEVHGDTPATDFVTEITYNARGQRESITYGNHTSTACTYDEHRFWLTGLTTTRSATSGLGAATLQGLTYSYDAVGNIAQIDDSAQQTEYFDNAQVTPNRYFHYDSLYRLVRASGREKVAQTQSTAFYQEYAGPIGGVPDPGNPALRRYTQYYDYDEAGNITMMRHRSGGFIRWQRDYGYETWNNQLLENTIPGSSTSVESYGYNARGAMTSIPHLQSVTRDFRDQIRHAELNLSGDEAWYSYDAGGQRVRKLWDKGNVREERIYLGGYEVWRKRDASNAIVEERQTLHVMDDQRRIALVETLTVTGGSPVTSPQERLRYQLDDHLGTAAVETDHDGGVITYEEYHAYGTTSWWAEKSGLEVSRKRYRYTGKEKDEETGLSYHNKRYYLSWLGRWAKVDPAGFQDGLSRFAYCRDNPIRHSDRGGMAVDGEQSEQKSPLDEAGRGILMGELLADPTLTEALSDAGAQIGASIASFVPVPWVAGPAEAAGIGADLRDAIGLAKKAWQEPGIGWNEFGAAWGATELAIGAMPGGGDIGMEIAHGAFRIVKSIVGEAFATAWQAKRGLVALRGLRYAGKLEDLSPFEARVARMLHGRGDDIIGLGDKGVREALGIAKGRVADFVSATKSGRFNITEVKDSIGRGGADIDHALSQINNTIEGLEKAVGGAVKLGKLEIVLPSGGKLADGYSVVGNQLMRITDEGTEVVRIGGSVVHVTRMAR